MDLNLKTGYNTEDNDIINEFYVPVLSQAKEYLRIVGYFNSGSLSLVSKGLKDFIIHGSKMKLVCGSNLNEEDVKAICDATNSIEDAISENFIEELKSLSKEDNPIFNNIQILGWMVAHDLLDIKVAIKKDENGNITNEGILHAKVGILEDFEGNLISFIGSNNETAAALKNNFEQFDVSNSWNDYSFKQLKNHLKTFDKYWEESIDSYEIMSVPVAVERELIKCSPKHFDELKFNEDNYVKSNKSNKPQLFNYQLNARESWFKNNRRGIFAMATGTGKTFTSLGCLEKIMELENNNIFVIAAPYQHLVQQWLDSIESFGLKNKVDNIIVADSSNSKWKSEIANAIYEVEFDIISNIIIVTTHKTLSGDKFINLISEDVLNSNLMLIADEMHGLGSNTYRNGLLSIYDYRLGLSATPERVFDEIGTDLLKNYFNDTVYEFSLKEALHTINPLTNETYLTEYNYYPYFVNLSTDELEEYKKLTSRIIRKKNSLKNEDESSLERLYELRADIIKNTNNKYDILRKILNNMGNNVRDLIIYCSDQQIEKVISIVGEEYGLTVSKFTNEESAKIEKKWGNNSERGVILEKFAEGTFQCLVAMKCLDEGVDVPSATNAILMCNSTNPREFIQRLGRVIRRYPGKDVANIYDLIVKPHQAYDNTLKNVEDYIYNKELDRAEQIVKLAKNKEIKYKLYS